MKRYMDWWGCVLVPETEAEITALEMIPEQATVNYEDFSGSPTATWETDGLEFMFSKKLELPMGKALVIHR